MRTRQDDHFGEMLERQMKSEHHELFREISEATDTLISAVKSVCDPRFAAAGRPSTTVGSAELSSDRTPLAQPSGSTSTILGLSGIRG